MMFLSYNKSIFLFSIKTSENRRGIAFYYLNFGVDDYFFRDVFFGVCFFVDIFSGWL
jgi:hypothetical protein